MSLRRILLWLGRAVLVLLAVVLAASYLVPLPASPDDDPATLLPAGARLIQVPGEAGRTAVMEAGAPGAPAVVLIHGFGGSTFSWRLTVPALAAAGYRVVALDLLDFGLSEKRWDTDTSHAAQARHVLAVMDALGIRRAVVAGHSMGGSVALHVAMAAPERVAALVLVDAAAREPGEGGALAGVGQALASGALQLPPVQQVARQAIRRLISPDALVDLLRSAYADPAFVTPAVAVGYQAQARTRDWDLALLAVSRDQGGNALPRALNSLTVPTQVIWGRVDPWIPLARGEALAAAIPGARLDVIDGAGHLPFEERAEAFMAVILPFLAQHPA